MLMKGLDRCLYLYTEEEWRKYVNTYVENKSDENETAHDLKLFFYGNSSECDIDRQGRINLPRDYVEYADIQKEMVNVGFGSRIEIWSKEIYDSKMSSEEMNPRKLLGRIHTNTNQP
jgi:MraZ protein